MPFDVVSVLDEQDAAVVRRAGYGRQQTLVGNPALVLVDFQYAYLGEDVPILDQLDRWPTGGGQTAWAALRRALPVLALARLCSLPVVLTRIAYGRESSQSDPFAPKRGSQRYLTDGNKGAELAAELKPCDKDHLVVKQAASAFLGTDLDDYLAEVNPGYLLLGGLSTSGCVRATAVDAAARGYRVAVIADATADRIRLSHRVALLDMWMKYASIVDADEARRLLENEVHAGSTK